MWHTGRFIDVLITLGIYFFLIKALVGVKITFNSKFNTEINFIWYLRRA
jgi:hypothetical protein